MSVRIGVLTEDSTLADGLKAAFTAAEEPLIAASCDEAIAKLKEKKFTALFTSAEDRNYRQAVQKALDAGLGKEYYEALIERKTPLTAMTEEDLKAPVQGAAAAAVPSLLVAGLTAIVAFASA
ncbi:uncharacterized protein EMH_0099560 [Eimeria mitis]|uniref:Uncharacterized protein n=1 Tax=Eimeria mitis TaxID=44415 RepID=U6JRR7_9EIME|nr:uncharacterized protein EMH_0099560 [Eimeria mitis]CDJ28155.1 hypothetical protein, conserved [Eimeria mitis]